MGFSGELQYGLSIVLIAVLINFVILNYKLHKFKKYAFLIIIFYTIIKVVLLKIFNFDKNIIDLAIVTMIFLLIFFILEFYVFKKKEKHKDQLIAEIKVGYLYGIILIIAPFIMLIFNLQVYNGELKNLVLIFIECSIAGIIYIISVRKGLNYEKNSKWDSENPRSTPGHKADKMF